MPSSGPPDSPSPSTWVGCGTTVPSGVSVGIQDSIEQTLRVVDGYLDDGYVRIKLKIAPGWDVEPVRAVRAMFGDDVPLQVDANAAYTLLDTPTLRRLDEFGLLLLEQPLAEDDLRQHADPGHAGADPDLPGRVGGVRGLGRRRDRPRRRPGDQHQAGSGRRLSGGRPHPRPRQGERDRRLVRRDGRDRTRTLGQRRSRVPAGIRAARRHLRLRALLRARPHRTRGDGRR